ncbi:MAG TPA: hypothetical protein VM759_04420 [Longimicrobium sp.]|nr:hypothetical protein [Longimicrobium sp.]
MIWTTMDRDRHFILPDDAELAPGGLALRTATGRERTVDEAAVLPYEVTEEEARAWARAQLGEVFGEIREQTLGFVERLRQKTAAMREENRRTWDQAVADAPPEVREAGAHLRDLLKDLGATLRQAAREHGAGSAPSGDSADGASATAPSGSTSTETTPSAPDGSATVVVDGSTPVVVDGSTTAMVDESTTLVVDGSSSAEADGSAPSISGNPSAPTAARPHGSPPGARTNEP